MCDHLSDLGSSDGWKGVMELRDPGFTPGPQLGPRSAGVREAGPDGLLLPMGFWVEGGEVLDRPEALRPLVKLTPGPGELGRDPAAPFSATADLRGIVPSLKYKPFLGGWGLSAGQEKSEILGFLGIAPGVEEG